MALSPPPDTPTPKRGFFVNVGSLVSARAFLALSQIFVLPIVARYVSIEDFAVMALAMTVVIFCQVLSDAGLGRSLIRSKGYDLTEWSTVFWFLVGVGLALAAITIALSFVWAWFFDLPLLVPVMSTLAVVPLCQSISAAPNAEIERRENYTGIARIQMTTTVVSLGLAVGLALLGFGIWALVAQQVALAAVRLLGIWRLSNFHAMRAFSAPRLKPHLKFAKDSLSVSAILALAEQGVVMLIGKLLGNIQLGLFSMSQRFSRLPQFGLAGPMSTVVYVRMAKAQDDDARLIALYLASVRLLGFAILPAMATIAIAGEAIFTVFLSADWAPVAPVFALSIGGLALEAVALVCLTCLFRAKGRTELNVRLALDSAGLRLALVLGGCLISLEAVALALALWGLLIVPRGWALARRVVPLNMGDGLAALGPALLAGGAILVLHNAFTVALTPDHWAEIGLVTLVWVTAMAGTFAVFRRPLTDAIGAFRTSAPTPQ
ncbi:MAG: oligosaccharide flippase family protein [Pseudomonadota bacterium]